MIPVVFGSPLLLLGLAALPVIWWLLRYTPPRPQAEPFPPLKILLGVPRKEETPDRSPWWLTLLRLLMAAAVIVALANPVFNPSGTIAAGEGALALIVDNGWASGPDWKQRVVTARRLIDGARERGVPVVLAFTVEPKNAEIGPFDAEEAAKRLAAAGPIAAPVDRAEAWGRVAAALASLPGADVAILSDGLASPGDTAAAKVLAEARPHALRWIAPARLDRLAVVADEIGADAFSATIIRPANETAPRVATTGFYDERGRRIGDATANFGQGETEATARLEAPFELRNDIVSLSVDGEHHAGAVRVTDDSQKRRRVGLISAADADQAQPLLSPLFYIRRALEPFADLAETGSADLTTSLPALLDRKPAIIVLADVGVLPDGAREKLADWIDQGGTLVRFAGPRLAATQAPDDLLPVRLRAGDRTLGGALSWTEPQPLAEFPPNSPFANLAPPRDVTVNRQVLAEPGPELAERTWANLADGTPLVTGERRGKGTIVLFHVTPEATWSNLPISGTFVDMLRRLVQIARNQGRIASEPGPGAKSVALAPWRIISPDGVLGTPPAGAEPLSADPANARVTLANPPGLYGSAEGVTALNLLSPETRLEPASPPDLGVPVSTMSYAEEEAVSLKGPLIALALGLAAIDTIAVLALAGAFARRPRLMRAATVAVVLVALAALAVPAFAADARPGDDSAVAAITKTRLAYVLTGDPAVDAISRAGLAGLTSFLTEKTALEPAEPAGVDISTDELAFYPLLYWPVDPAAPLPSEAAMSRIDAYMRQGGTVLFDTRDQLESGFSPDGGVSASTERLRDILSALNIPPLEPVRGDHVLTKAFYLLDEFPGLYAGSPLWVEASQSEEARDGRPVRSGDGVSPILITANDFAGAWAIDANGEPLLPIASGDREQRVYALRAGVNIAMYVLTGNYKSDQVHIPALLERLGQ
jgi:hypothetical protein